MQQKLTYLFFLILLPFCFCNAQNNFTIKHSKLRVHFDLQKKQVQGLANIKLIVLKPTNVIQLDAGFLTINSIKLSNKSNLKFLYDGKDSKAGLSIQLDKIYNSNTEIELEIDYHSNYVNESDPNNLGGSYGKGVRFFQPTKSTPIKRRQIWSNGEAEGNKYWYPCLETLDDLRTTEFIATVENDLEVISNGNLVSTVQNNDGTKTFHYKTDKPYPNYLTNFIVGEYVKVQQQFNGISFTTYCYPDEKTAAIASSNRLTDMAKFFSDYTGVTYPYSGYSQVMVQDFPFPSLTGQNMVSTISDNFVDDERTHKDFLYLWDGVEADALASQWFGNFIASKNWNNVWLTKSLSRYLDGLYNDYKNGHEEYLMWYHSFDMNVTLTDWSSGIQHPLVPEKIEDLNNFLFGDNYLRSRGSLLLRILELEIGKDNFKKSIQHFVKNNAYKTVTTFDFQKSVETVTDRKMDWFFDQWIHKAGQPKLEITKTYDAAKKQVNLKISQTQKPDSVSLYPQVAYFQGKMEIEIDGKIETINLSAKPENSFRIDVQKEPGFVNIDFENTWIAEITMQKSIQENLSQFEISKDVLARINALNELATAYKDTTTSAIDKNIIYHSLLKVAESNAYWRFRMAVLSTLDGMLTKPFDTEMKTILLKIIQNENALLKATAVRVLGNENNTSNADLFIQQLSDSSDRVIFNAAIALGKTKSPKAFDALVKLIDKPSWKEQSKMAALTGMRLLADERAVSFALDILKDNHSPRWFLGASGWDYPVYAATTLASFNKGNLGYDIILERFNQAMKENDINDIFSNVLLIAILADSRGQKVFDLLKTKYKDDANAMNALNGYKEQFKNALGK